MDKLSKEYCSQFTNRSMRRALLQRANIGILEEILSREQNKFMRLRTLKESDKLEFGCVVGHEEANRLFSEISNEVNELLGITAPRAPKFAYGGSPRTQASTLALLFGGLSAISYLLYPAFTGEPRSNDMSVEKVIIDRVIFFAGGISAGLGIHRVPFESSYNSWLKKLNIKKEKRIDVMQSIAHEYAHHLQSPITGIFRLGYRTFAEGHSIGVQRLLAEKQREAEDNEAFLYDTTRNGLNRLGSVYLWLSKKFGLSPKKSLLGTKETGFAERFNDFLMGLRNEYAMGDALFQIFEVKIGKMIYGDVISGRFSLQGALK